MKRGGWESAGGEKVALPSSAVREGLANSIIIDCYYYRVCLQR